MPARAVLSIVRATGLAFTLSLSSLIAAQEEEEPVWETATEFELGAVYTSGNTDDENLRVGAEFEASRASWDYDAQFEGFRSSKDDELTAERFYLVGSTQYNYDEGNFAQLRASHEQDEFSGFERQTDFVVSYGQLLLRGSEDMTLDYTIGAGVRNSDDGMDTNNEIIFRVAGNYSWDFNENVRLIQEISSDAGDTATVTRSLSAVESDIMENMSLRFSYRLRHQSNVPSDRDKLDTETSMTVVLRF